MRITIHLPNALEEEVKAIAQQEHKSISAFLAEAADYYIRNIQKKRAGEKMLELFGNTSVSSTVLETLQQGRNGDDRA